MTAFVDRGLCPECNRVVPVKAEGVLRTHRVTREDALICPGARPVEGRVWLQMAGDVEPIATAKLESLRTRLTAAERRVELIAADKHDVEAELALLRTTHFSAVDPEKRALQEAIDAVLESGKLTMKQVGAFWDTASGRMPVAKFEEVLRVGSR